MTKKEAAKIIKDVCLGKLNIVYTDHFWERVDERVPGFTTMHAMQVLKNGTIREDPVRDDEFNNHTIKMRATVTDFGEVGMAIGLRVFDDAVGLTIYGLN